MVTKLHRHAMGELHTLLDNATMRRRCATEAIVCAVHVLKYSHSARQAAGYDMFKLAETLSQD